MKTQNPIQLRRGRLSSRILVAVAIAAATCAMSWAGGVKGRVTQNGKPMAFAHVGVVAGGQQTYVTTDGSGFYRCELPSALAGQIAVAFVVSKRSYKTTVAIPAVGYNTLNLSYSN